MYMYDYVPMLTSAIVYCVAAINHIINYIALSSFPDMLK